MTATVRTGLIDMEGATPPGFLGLRAAYKIVEGDKPLKTLELALRLPEEKLLSTSFSWITDDPRSGRKLRSNYPIILRVPVNKRRDETQIEARVRSLRTMLESIEHELTWGVPLRDGFRMTMGGAFHYLGREAKPYDTVKLHVLRPLELRRHVNSCWNEQEEWLVELSAYFAPGVPPSDEGSLPWYDDTRKPLVPVPGEPGLYYSPRNDRDEYVISGSRWLGLTKLSGENASLKKRIESLHRAVALEANDGRKLSWQLNEEREKVARLKQRLANVVTELTSD